MATNTFFNLPSAGATSDTNGHIFGLPTKHNIQTNWYTFEDRPMSMESLIDVFANRIPVVRVPAFLSPEECESMLQIIKTHNIGSYDTENTWPRVGVAGITQYDHIKGKVFVEEARSLQNRWKNEVGIDIIARVVARLQQTTNMRVQLATEEDKEYFAGVVRAVDRGIGVHADSAPYEAAGWDISNIAVQVTWNILLNKVPGGNTLIYDRQWQAPDDDLAWRKEFPRDSYHPQMLQGHPFKAMKAVPGDLTFFNPRYVDLGYARYPPTLTKPLTCVFIDFFSSAKTTNRNFHEVRACDTSRSNPVPAIRFTVSSFVGFLPSRGSQPDTLVLWS